MKSHNTCVSFLKFFIICRSKYFCDKIRLIEGYAKCRHLKKLTFKGLCGRCLSVWGPGERGNSSQRWGRKYQHDRLYLQSINSDKHLPQSPFTDHFF